MKKLLTIALFIAVTSLANAQTNKHHRVTVTAGKVSITLTAKQMAIIARYNDPTINKAIETMRVIKYNSTADIIIAILKQHKS